MANQNVAAEAKYIKNASGERAFVIGTPEHTNLGDSALELAEIALLRHCGVASDQIAEITVGEFERHEKIALKLIRANKQISAA